MEIDGVADWPNTGFEEYRQQWFETCESMRLTYREDDAVKFAREAGWDGERP